MPPLEPILAYFGPETVFPVASFLAGIVGFVLMLGKSSWKYAVKCVKSVFRKSKRSC